LKIASGRELDKLKIPKSEVKPAECFTEEKQRKIEQAVILLKNQKAKYPIP